MPKDPVCGQEISEKSKVVAKYKGKTYYFCCASCQWAFERDPNRFIRP